MRLHIRHMMRKSDLPTILCIEESIFDSPWDEDDFQKQFTRANTLGLTAVDVDLNPTIVGYLMCELWQDQVQVLNIGVHPARQRHGIGRALINELKSNMSSLSDMLIATVCETNLKAHLFLKGCGFKAVKIIDNFYTESNKLAYRFEFKNQR